MTLFQSPVGLLLLAALGLTLLGAGLKKGHILSFLGGMCYAAGVVWLYLDGGTTQEVLLVTMVLLAASRWRRGERHDL